MVTLQVYLYVLLEHLLEYGILLHILDDVILQLISFNHIILHGLFEVACGGLLE